MVRKLLVLAIVTLAGALLPGPASAHLRGVAPRKDPQCVADCRAAMGTCVSGARASARLAAGECGGLLKAARDACSAQEPTAACRSARQAVRECIGRHREALHATVRECRGTARQCLALCPDRPPLALKDPACVFGCRRNLGACQATANAAAQECAIACSELAGEVRSACAAGRSAGCLAARQAASDCLLPCREALAGASRLCMASAQGCVQSCPE